MQPLPHHYNVTVTAKQSGNTEITSRGLESIVSAPPREFDGPGNLWSPETFTVAAVTDCFALTFRAIANVSGLQWTNLVCSGEGSVERADGVIRFTAMTIDACLQLPADGNAEKARRLLEKAEKNCLIGNSLKFKPVLRAQVSFETLALPA